jgi:hypothetical protein
VEYDCAANYVFDKKIFDPTNSYNINQIKKLLGAWLTRRTKVNPSDGMAHLRKQCEDKAEVATIKWAHEVMVLYVWWTAVRPNRRNSPIRIEAKKYDEELMAKYTGVGEDDLLFGYSQLFTQDERIKLDALQTAAFELDEYDDQEDEDMLIRLMKIRKSLWT